MYSDIDMIIRGEVNKIEPMDRESVIRDFKIRIKVAKINVDSLEKILKVLQEEPAKSPGIRWREEIRDCLDKHDTPLTSAGVSECVAIRNDVEVDKHIKLKISTTLSMLFNEKEIGRYIPNGERDYYYGSKRLFIKDENGKLTELNTGI